MIRPGFLTVTLRPGESLSHIPAHVDVLIGSSRKASWLDGGILDRAVRRAGCYCRATTVFHAHAALGRPGEHNSRYDETEEMLGLSRTYEIELDRPERTRDVVAAMRDLRLVESAAPETLACTSASAVPVNPTEVRKLAREQHERVEAFRARAIEPGDARVSIAVVDTGVALGHPELQTRLLAGYDVVNLGQGMLTDNLRLVGDSRGRDFAPLDMCGHGSVCAGTIGARGFSIPPGVCGECMLMPIRVLAAARTPGNPKLVGVGAIAEIEVGIKVAVDLGADIINMSFGTPESAVDPEGPRPHQRIVQYAASKGCILVAASGNSGAEERFYPAALPEVIAVGSMSKSGRRSRFSTYGPHIALCAPGEDIISTGLRGYKASTGTSHAAPFVSGAAALLLSRARRHKKELSGSEVASILTATASRRDAGSRDNEIGHGMLNALEAIRLLDRTLSNRGRIAA